MSNRVIAELIVKILIINEKLTYGNKLFLIENILDAVEWKESE